MRWCRKRHQDVRVFVVLHDRHYAWEISDVDLHVHVLSSYRSVCPIAILLNAFSHQFGLSDTVHQSKVFILL